MSVESTNIDPYEAVLNDLRAQRDQINQAIEALETLRSQKGGTASPSGSAAGAKPSGKTSVANGDLLGLSIVEATKKLLATKRTQLRNPELVTLFKEGGLILNSKDWANTIGAVLTRRANEVGDIVKIDRGTWGLKEWYPGRSFKAKGDNGDKGEVATATVVPTEGPGEHQTSVTRRRPGPGATSS